MLIAGLTALTLAPASGHPGPLPLAGTAQAAKAGNPIATVEDLLRALRGARDLPEEEWALPRIWKPPSTAPAVAIANWRRRIRAAELGRRLETETWTCDAAEYLEHVETINKV